MSRINTSIADGVAAEMSALIDSDEYREIFSGPEVNFSKTASAKKLPPWLEKGKKDDKKKDDKKDDKKKDDKKKDEKKDKNKCGLKPPSKKAFEASVEGLAKISEILDDMGMVKSATLTIRALEQLVSEAQELQEQIITSPGASAMTPEQKKQMEGLETIEKNLPSYCDDSFAKDKKEKEEKEKKEKEDKEEEKEDEDKDEKDDDKKDKKDKEDKDDAYDVSAVLDPNTSVM